MIDGITGKQLHKRAVQTGTQLQKSAEPTGPVQTGTQLQKSAEPTGPVQTGTQLRAKPTGPVQTVLDHGANVLDHGAKFAGRVFAGLKSRFLAAVKRHKPFDQNVALPVVMTKGVTYKLVKISVNDYMWEIKGWNSIEPEKSFLVPTGWILQMPDKGVEPC